MNRDILRITVLSFCFILVLKFLSNIVLYCNQNDNLASEQINCLKEAFRIQPMPSSKITVFYPQQRGDLGLRYEFGFDEKAKDNEVFNYYSIQLKQNSWKLENKTLLESKEYALKKYKKEELKGVVYCIRKYNKSNKYRIGVIVDYKDNYYKKLRDEKRIKTKPFYSGWMSLVK